MDPRLLRYYNRELQFIREMGGEFAREFPKIAGRLGMEGFEVADPYVERLLEGFAFLASRVQLKLDAEFPAFTQQLLEVLVPPQLAPTPSMAIVQLQPNLQEAELARGFPVPRGAVMRSVLGRGEQTACEYRTCHPVTLFPVELVRAQYTGYLADLGDVRELGRRTPRAALRLRLRAMAGLTFSSLALDRLPLYLKGEDEVALRLYEQLGAHAVGALVRGASGGAWRSSVAAEPVTMPGFGDDEAVLPYPDHAFRPYRLLHEYFAFPGRFLFAAVEGLGEAVRAIKESEIDIVVLLDAVEPSLESMVDTSRVVLHCTPVVNLFSRATDRIHLTDKTHEFLVLPDRTRPLDFEVHSVESVVGFGASAEVQRTFLPFYGLKEHHLTDEAPGYYTIDRRPRLLSSRQRQAGPRSTYIGHEVFLSLVDGNQGPFRSTLKQVSVQALCTNRDLPLQMVLGTGRTDFTMDLGGPIQSVRVVAGPTPPRSSVPSGETSWRLIGHLALNHLSLTDGPGAEGASALRALLGLYAEWADSGMRRQIEGLRSIASRSIARRLPLPGPLTFARGLEVTLTADESAFEGSGVYLLGSVLARFFSRYVSINSFVETVLRTVQRGEVVRWPAELGTRKLL